MSESPETEYGLVMPFVVCRSKGGPYDDEAYVAGFEAGRLDALLSLSPLLAGTHLNEGIPYHSENLPQIDLIAMRHGVDLETVDVAEGWASVTFSNPSDAL